MILTSKAWLLSVISNFFDLSDVIHMAATGLSPPGNKTSGSLKRKEESLWQGQALSLAVRPLGLERDHKREGLLGAFKALVMCLEFSGKIFINHLLGDCNVLRDCRCNLSR